MQSQLYQSFRKRYQIINLIGAGGFGKVYKVQDTQYNLLKAEKISIKPIQDLDKQTMCQQAEILIKLNHPNIIKGYQYILQQKRDEYDHSVTGYYIHIIMEYFNGKQLSDYLTELTVTEIERIYKQIKSALIYLQKQKIVHRDIGLDNILLDENMNIKITDFGISSTLKEEKKYYLTQFGRGKNPYRAPEIWSGRKVTINSDLWALGIIILELFFVVNIQQLFGSKPGDKQNFPSEFYEKYAQMIPVEIMRIVEPLLQRDHNNRRFYDYKYTDEVEDKVIILKDIKTDKKITSKMTLLWLSYNNIGPQGALEIANNLKYIVWLDLSSNNIGKEGAKQIAKNLRILNKLYLDNNNIETEGAVYIAKNLNKLAWLDLSRNNIMTEGAVEIAKNLINLIVLWLNNNNIGTEGGEEIAKNLLKLKWLDLKGNNIETNAAVQISKLKDLSELYLQQQD